MIIWKKGKILFTLMIWLLLASISSQLYLKLFFSHSHVSNNGFVYYHAHPYATDDNGENPVKHYHSDFELAFLSNIDFFTLAIVLLLSISLGVFNKNQICIETFFIKRIRLDGIKGRAPPVMG